MSLVFGMDVFTFLVETLGVFSLAGRLVFSINLRVIWWLRNWPRSGFFLLSASACYANALNVYHVYTPTHYGTPSAVYYGHLPRGRHGEAPYGTALHGTSRHFTALHRHCTAPRPFFYVMPSPENYAYIIMCFDHLNSWGCREAQLP